MILPRALKLWGIARKLHTPWPLLRGLEALNLSANIDGSGLDSLGCIAPYGEAGIAFPARPKWGGRMAAPPGCVTLSQFRSRARDRASFRRNSPRDRAGRQGPAADTAIGLNG